MSLSVKFLLVPTVITTMLGAAAFSWNSQQQPSAAPARNAARPVAVGPSKDDPLKVDGSWKRWPSLTDF